MRRKKWILIVGSVLIIEGITALGLSVISTGGRTAEGNSSKPMAAARPAYRERKELEIYERNKRNLILVNAVTPLAETYDANCIPICRGRLQASKALYKPLAKMLKDAGKKGFHYWIASAWRSREKQQRLVDEDVQKAMSQGFSYEEALRQTYRETMPAGHSEHETGLALDILCSGNINMNSSQEKESGNVWLRKNCYRYGFILRYPKGKEKITGIDYEPWHFRYVGKEAALYMKKQDMTLEEFWDKIYS